MEWRTLNYMLHITNYNYHWMWWIPPNLQLKFDHDYVYCWKAFWYGTGRDISFCDISGRTKLFLYSPENRSRGYTNARVNVSFVWTYLKVDWFNTFLDIYLPYFGHTKSVSNNDLYYMYSYMLSIQNLCIISNQSNTIYVHV